MEGESLSTAELLASSDRLLVAGKQTLHDIRAARAATDEHIRLSRACVAESKRLLDNWNRIERGFFNTSR